MTSVIDFDLAFIAIIFYANIDTFAEVKVQLTYVFLRNMCIMTGRVSTTIWKQRFFSQAYGDV